MGTSLMLSAAYGWFAGLLVIMIIVCALFGLIMFIALRPVSKADLEDTTATKLKRREAELASQLLKTQNDKQATEQLMSQLREVQSAEKLVNELTPEENKPAAKPAKAKPAQASAAKPSKPVQSAQPAQTAQPAQAPAAQPEQTETVENK